MYITHYVHYIDIINVTLTTESSIFFEHIYQFTQNQIYDFIILTLYALRGPPKFFQFILSTNTSSHIFKLRSCSNIEDS